ncbi:MAG TPA: helix-turn-helix domain-containing protein, partial [Cyclobacteriaceae bacterium]|nr:helix-turn-helix domain-containing protein [Cyclobacteriaceae bacterium]
DNERAELYNRARTLVEEEKLYLNERLRLRDVAAKMNVPDYLLSQIINDVAGRSFTELINLYRVDEVKARLASPSFANLTVEAIGSDSGFSSKASFYAAFKRHTGITPKEYRQKLSK